MKPLPNKEEKQLQEAISKRDRAIIELTLASSKTLTENMIVPDIVARHLSSHFAVKERGGTMVVVPVDKDGNHKLSFINPGEPAELGEILEELIKSKALQRYAIPDDLKAGNEEPGVPAESKTPSRPEALIQKYREAVANRNAGDMMLYFEELNKMGVRIPQQ